MPMAPQKIMLIRHAERPGVETPDQGVNLDGSNSSDALIVRGWQRAGALARFFAPLTKNPSRSLIETPTSLYAAQPDELHHSDRTRQTLEPLSAMLGLPINIDHRRGEEPALADAIARASGIVLIAWEHNAIHNIVADVTQNAVQAPDWPDDRFDMVYVLTANPTWLLAQVPQEILATDQSQTF
jgi:hypothetical protein